MRKKLSYEQPLIFPKRKRKKRKNPAFLWTETTAIRMYFFPIIFFPLVIFAIRVFFFKSFSQFFFSL